MSGKFYSGQSDYIEVLNDLADALNAAAHSPGNNTTQSLSLSTARVFFETLSSSAGTTSFSFANMPSKLNYYEVLVYVKQNSGATQTVGGFSMSGATFKWTGGAAPSPILTATANTVDVYKFTTFDAGVTWYAHRISSDHR